MAKKKTGSQPQQQQQKKKGGQAQPQPKKKAAQPTSQPKKKNAQQKPNKNENGGGEGSMPLETEWTYWYDRRLGMNAGARRPRDSERSYESNLKPVATFGTVEDFWKVTNHMTKPSRLDMKANYHLFKKGIKPMWEDSANVQGGKWTLEIQNNGELLDSFWESMIIGMIGECMDDNDDICGAVVSRRKVADKVSVWNREKNDEDTIMRIGKKLREFLPEETDLKLSYQTHEDSMRTGQSYTNPSRFTI